MATDATDKLLVASVLERGKRDMDGDVVQPEHEDEIGSRTFDAAAELGVKLSVEESQKQPWLEPPAKLEEDDEDKPSTQAELDAMSMSPFESSVMSVTARLEPVADAAPGIWNARIELDAREILLEKKDGRWLGALAILLVQKKSDGSTVASSHQALNLNLEQKTYERLLRDGLKMSKKLTLDPGAEEVRIIVRDASSGTTGSVFIPLNQLAAAK